MPDRISKRVTKLEEKVSHLERLNAPRQDNPHSVRPQNHVADNRDSAPRSPTLSNDRPRDSAYKPEDRSRKSKPWWIRMWTWKPWKRGLAVIAGLAGIAYAIITYRQWHDLGTNFKIEQRAWLAIKDDVATGFKQDAEHHLIPSVFTFQIVNSGKSPAMDVVVYRKMKVVPISFKFTREKEREMVKVVDDISNAVFKEATGDSPTIPDVIAPGSTVNEDVRSDVEISMPEIKGVYDSTSILVVAGAIRYRDAFQALSEAPRETEFCMWFIGDLGKAGKCKHGNMR